MYCGQQSCGCKKKEHDKALAGYLVHVDGTSIDALKSDKIPKNNTTGVKGVYRIKGHYLTKIVFQHRQYSLGTYESLEAAAEARKKAEELLNEKVVGFYEKWSEKAAAARMGHGAKRSAHAADGLLRQSHASLVAVCKRA